MNKIIRFIFGLIGAVVGITTLFILVEYEALPKMTGAYAVLAYIAAALFSFGIFYVLALKVYEKMREFLDYVTAQADRFPLLDIIISFLGLLLGLIIAGIVSNPVLQLSISRLGNVLGVVIAIFLYMLFGALGIRLALHYKEEIKTGLKNLRSGLLREDDGGIRRTPRAYKRRRQIDKEDADRNEESYAKILDTSVIIDGRIFEVMRTGFLQGPIVISHYVLEELQFVSDSSDPLKRERGRKGLDRIRDLQTGSDLEIIVDNSNIDKVKEVDLKLMLLTKQYGGCLVTNDYNLNKVSSVQNIPVLNVNDLANALKPIVIPGEHMRLHIIKEGKEDGQGLAYLDDGTMIVIENGYKAIGKTVDTVVTSVLQTSAGKMIFTRIED